MKYTHRIDAIMTDMKIRTEQIKRRIDNDDSIGANFVVLSYADAVEILNKLESNKLQIKTNYGRLLQRIRRKA